MAKWKHTVELYEDFQQYEQGNLTIPELGQCVASKLRTFQTSVMYDLYEKDELEQITMQFEDVVEIEDFDDALTELYEWADFEHRMWVNINFPSMKE